MPSTHTRRDLLRRLGTAGAGALSAAAGCVDRSPGGRSDGSERTTGTRTDGTPEPTSSTESTETVAGPGVRALGDVRVSVTDPVARKAVAYESVMGSGGVLAPAGRQFVVTAVRSAVGTGEFDAAGGPPHGAFSLVAGDDSYPAVDVEDRTTGAYTTSLAGRGEAGYDLPYAGSRSVGWLAFELPSPLDVDAAEIRCERGGSSAAWPLPEAAVATLSRPAPTFELRSFDAEPTEGGSVEITLVAENTGDVDGEFLAAVYWPTERIADDDESTPVRDDVAAGERIEWHRTFDARYAAFEDGPVTARIDGVVTGSATVDVDVATTVR